TPDRELIGRGQAAELRELTRRVVGRERSGERTAECRACGIGLTAQRAQLAGARPRPGAARARERGGRLFGEHRGTIDRTRLLVRIDARVPAPVARDRRPGNGEALADSRRVA